MKIDPKIDVLWRVYLLYVLMVLFGIAVLVKIIIIQTKEKEELLLKAEKREERFKPVEAHRGNVISKNGTLLATSIPVFDVAFDPCAPHDTVFNREIENLAACLNSKFGKKSKSKYISDLTRARRDTVRYVRLATKLSLAECKEVSEFPIFRHGKNKGGFIAERRYVRNLPYGILAARTIGYTRENDKDSVYIYVGIEGAYNDYLKGKKGQQAYRRINGNFWMPVPDPFNSEPVNGDDVYTSIDIELQDVAENALMNCLISNKADQGCVVLMDVKSGFVEVMASLSYNGKTSKYEEAYNFALRHNVEPGSTFKAITMLALLENDPSMSIDDKINIGTTGYKVFYKKTLEDSHKVNDDKGYTTIRNAFEQSSNIAFATMVEDAFKQNPQKFIDQIYKTKINEPLNLDIQGAASPYIKNVKDNTWSKLTLPWMSVGYEVQISPIQLLTYYNAIANDGVMVKPQFVKEIRHGGELLKSFDTVVINKRIASPRTIDALQTLLKGVVENGTAKSMSKLGFSVAGKTGTAQISQGGGYNKKNYTATFVGYFPADNPQYSCIIMVSNPQGGKYYGGSVSAPVFKELAEKIYATRLGIVEEESDYQADCKSFADASMVYYDDFINFCNIEDVHFVDDAESDKWVSVDMDEDVASVKHVVFEENKVPDVKGMNATDAVCLLESMGWKVTFTGYGRVKTQSVRAGSDLKKGSVINLTLNTK